MKKIDIMKECGREYRTVLCITKKAWLVMDVTLRKLQPIVQFKVFHTHDHDYSFSSLNLETAIKEFNKYN